MELMPGAAELAEAFARELATGADLDHPLFPVVWPAGG